MMRKKIKSNTLSQEPAQWLCLYNARKYNYDWIITTDVDEFIHVLPKKNNGGNSNNNNTIVRTKHTATTDDLPPLQSYLKRYDPNHYSSLIMHSIPFGSNNFIVEQPADEDNLHLSSNDYDNNKLASSSLMLDYVWRRNWNLSEYPLYRHKQIYSPRHAWSIGVHYCWMADKDTKKDVVLPAAEDGLYVQHYKLAHKGVYKNHEKNMIKSVDELRMDTRLRDNYREALVLAMQQRADNP